MGYTSENHPALDNPDVWVPYRYKPSVPAATVFVVLFSITTFFHVFQLVKKRTWYFIPLVLGGFFEIVGYIGRIISSNDMWAEGPFIMQSILLLVAPALFAASIYIILGRIILLVDGERYSLLRQKWLTAAFVTGDVLSFLVQSGGGAILGAGTESAKNTGESLIVIGLFLQLAFFGFFVLVAGMFHYRLVRDRPVKHHLSLNCFRFVSRRRGTNSSTNPINAAPSSSVDINSIPWKRHIYALYAASIIILVRSLFRVIEYIQGNSGFLLKKEVFLYVFDAALMFFVMVLFNWVHPSEITERMKRRKTVGGVDTPDLELQGSKNGERV